MEQQRFDVSFKGELLPGFELDQVRQNLGQLFKANEAQLNKLFSGQLCSVKKDVDKATALKYQQALKKAGAKPLISKAAESDTPATAATPTNKPATVSQATTSATSQPQKRSDTPATGEPEPSSTRATATTKSSSSLSVLPVGTDVLAADERKAIVERDIDTSALSASAEFEQLSPEKHDQAVAPNTDHIQLGETGEDMSPYARQEATSIDLDAKSEHLDLAETGTNMQDEYREHTELPLDLSAMSMAEVGTRLSDKKTEAEPPAPDTSHLQLEKPNPFLE